MSKLTFFPTTEKLVSEIYPYGSKVKTTKTDWLEFSPKKGFRHISQTVDPETGRLNAPKKSRYNEIMLLAKDEKGRVKGWAATLGWDEAWQKFLPDLVENFALFTPEQVTFIYKYFLARIQVQVQSKIVCYGVQQWEILFLLEGAIDLTYKGIESQGTENYFAEINNSLDYAKIAACGVKDFNPFS